MQFESLEARQMMALVNVDQQGPVSGSNLPYTQSVAEYLYQDRIEWAFKTASNLAQYSTEQLQATDAWVIQVYPTANLNFLARYMGVTALTPEPLIHDTYRYEIPTSINRLDVGKALQTAPGVKYAYPLTPHDFEKKSTPNDPLYAQQWHLKNTGQTGGTVGADANVSTAWDTVTGTGVVIGVVDDGVQYTHPDLASKYRADLSIDLVDGDNNPAPDLANEDFHGTAVAGVAAAATNNGIGVSGTAPGAQVAGIRLLGANQDDSTEAAALAYQNQAIAVYNNSWGPPDGYATYTAIQPLALAAINNTVNTGRGGLGGIVAWAAGNGREYDDNSNYDGYANLPMVFAVAAVDHNGKQSLYSESGANVLISAPSSSGDFPSFADIVTTDIVGADGYNYAAGSAVDDDALGDLNYTSTFGGTSSATPVVAGVAALILQANPALTWRDVRQIMIQSAKKNDASDTGWSVNGAGYPINDKYGFGSIDATAAVNLARNWTLLPAEVGATTGMITGNVQIPDNSTNGVVGTVNITSSMIIESVDVLVDIAHTAPEDLEIVLISPSGTRSVLAEARIPDPFGPPGDTLQGWFFNTKRLYGENVQGNWTLEIRDLIAQDVGTVNGFRLDVYGHDTAANPVNSIVRGTVWNDTNSNGVQDGSEAGYAGTTVFIDANGNGALDTAEVSTTSLSDGTYIFNNLAAGNYTIDILPPTGGSQTFPVNGVGQTVTLAANQVISNINFGVIPPPSTVGTHILTNAPGDATTTVGVDGFGAFGSAAGANTTNATFDPIGGIGVAGTTFESGVALGINGRRVMLATDISGSNFTNPLVTGDTTTANSAFTVQGLQFSLNQSLQPLRDRFGNQIGSQLVQTYTITNPASSAINFDLVRYFDGDLKFDGSLMDGGGRLEVNGREILFETDSATGSAASTTFIGISTEGGAKPATNRYEASSYSQLLSRIITGDQLADVVDGDGADADQFVDAGNGYDITLALNNLFSLGAGESTTYTTYTYFGSASPDALLPPPPPPIEVTGVVINDFDTDGTQDTGEPGIANVIVYADLNNDNQIGLGEPAQITNARGEFGFKLREGTYTIRQAQVPGWTSTTPMVYSVTGAAGEIVGNLVFGNNSTIDWGDAPSPYPTLSSQSGASHSMLTGMFLGTSADGEGDGQPTSRANGDDLAADDENGVVFVNALQPGQTAAIDVTISNGGRSSGLLHAWIDFNADGDWSDAGEQIIANGRVNEGVNRLTFQVPATAKITNTYARFRYGYGANVAPNGNVLGGEVEDYFVSVVGPKPLANADTFAVYKNSTNNKLDVLLNDVASALGAVQISNYSGVGSKGGTIALNAADQTLVYTPSANTSGVETFSYTISDNKGGVASALVTVNVDTAGPPPVAVDDSFTAPVGSFGTSLNVLANDQLNGTVISALTVPSTSTARGGTVTVVAASQTITYRPASGFTGVDQFKYAIRDASGRRSEAVVTVTVGDSAADNTAGIEFVITDATGTPINEVAVGGTFQVRAYVRDLRSGPADPGVMAAYFDLLYSQAFVSPLAAANAYGFDVTFSPEFNALRSASATVPGLIDEIGAVRGTLPTDTSPTEVFRANFTAKAVGAASFASDPADLATLHEMRIGNPQQLVPLDKITFGGATINVVAAAAVRFQNHGNAHDVNNDGKVTPLDALLVINDLNSRGMYPVAGRSLPTSGVRYLDVSGDNYITVLDAAMIVNFLNRPLSQSEPLDDSTTVAVSPSSGVEKWLLPPEVTTSGTSDQLPSTANDAEQFEIESSKVLPPAFWLPTTESGSFGADGASESDELDDLLDLLADDIEPVWAD